LEPVQQVEQEHSGCVETIYLIFLKSSSSQAWSVRWRWQLFWRCEGQGRERYSEEHECDDSRI